VAASIGMGVGFGYYGVSVFATFLVLVMLVALRPIELRFFRGRKNRRTGDPLDMDPIDS
jgi:uncharacterized membrane protein YhiD involved in acid resistance